MTAEERDVFEDAQLSELLARLRHAASDKSEDRWELARSLVLHYAQQSRQLLERYRLWVLSLHESSLPIYGEDDGLTRFLVAIIAAERLDAAYYLPPDLRRARIERQAEDLGMDHAAFLLLDNWWSNFGRRLST